MVKIDMLHEPTIRAHNAAYPGTIESYLSSNSRRRVWRWYRSGEPAAQFLREIQPHSVAKLGEIEIALEFQRSLSSRARPRAYTPQERACCQALKERLETSRCSTAQDRS